MHVVMTRSATKFVTPLTFEVLSGHPVSTDVFEAHQEMKHLSFPNRRMSSSLRRPRPIALQRQRWGWATICSRPCS